MNALKKLQNVTPDKPYNGFAKLSKGIHQVMGFRFVKNKFGKKGDGSNKSILVELEDQVLFLPQYLSKKLNEEELNDLNSCIEKHMNFYLFFGGKSETNK